MPNTQTIATTMSAILLCIQIESAQAVEYEPMGKAIAAITRTMKGVSVKRDTIGGKPVELYYTKVRGKADKLAFIERGLYAPDCTHTWAIGIDSKSGRVTQVRVIEFKCNHAIPCKAASFLEQFKGKGPADAAKLDSQITPVAKATGSRSLTIEGVQRAIVAWQKLKGKI